jgi:hypothetical protein
LVPSLLVAILFLAILVNDGLGICNQLVMLRILLDLVIITGLVVIAGLVVISGGDGGGRTTGSAGEESSDEVFCRFVAGSTEETSSSSSSWFSVLVTSLSGSRQTRRPDILPIKTT